MTRNYFNAKSQSCKDAMEYRSKDNIQVTNYYFFSNISSKNFAPLRLCALALICFFAFSTVQAQIAVKGETVWKWQVKIFQTVWF